MKVIIGKGEMVEIVTEEDEGIDFPDIDENENDVEYIDTPFGIIKKGKGSQVTAEDYEAQQADLAEKAAARKAKVAADAIKAAEEAERLRIEAKAVAEKKAAAWQLKYPNKRRSETKPTEDPGEGFAWNNYGICKNCWTRTKVGI